MEEILKKDIFNNADLLKLSPDYNPSDLLLRMQMRRSLVKDTQSNKIKNNSFRRKNPAKRSYIINAEGNREIVKLKHDFQNNNLKNEINLKNCNSASCNTIPFVKRKAALSNKQACIDIDYTINDYEYGPREGIESFRSGNLLEDFSTHLNTSKYNQINVKKVKDQDINISPRLQLLGVHDAQKAINSGIVARKTTLQYVNNEKEATQVDDLQSLLIKMVITSESNEMEHQNKSKPVVLSEDEDDTIRRRENFHKLVLVSTPAIQENYEDFLQIKKFKSYKDLREDYLTKKCFKKWRTFLMQRKEVSSRKRQLAINKFFDKLEKKKQEQDQLNEPALKAKLLARDYSTYQHRYKMQRHIIALQKAKLEEQNRMIDELKYNKIVEASHMSVDAMKEEVRKTYYEIDRHLKPKIKCLTNELKIPEIEESSLVLHCLKVPQFLQRMEKRAREREEKHAIIRERRQQMEEERIRLKQQAELAKVEMDKEEKAKRIKELREKRKREKIENIRKKQQAERIRAMTVMAEMHYEKNILMRCGIQPLRRLIEIKRDNLEKARDHYGFQLKKNIFLSWMWYTEDMWIERHYKAEDMYRKKILRKTFDAIKKNHTEYILKRQVAEDFYELYVVQLVFREFQAAVKISKQENELKWMKAVAYHNSNLKFKSFVSWRSLPALNELQRELAARKARWREKVLQVVPDYSPPEY